MARATFVTRSAAAAAVVFLTTACTVHKQDTPSLTGPSELGKSLSITVNPDILSQDGQSQSVVSIDARDGNNQPLRNLPLRVDVTQNGKVVDDALGRLSARSLVTDGGGHASVIYTAPSLPSGFPIAAGIIQIAVTPQEGDFGNSSARAVGIKLVVPPGVGAPPSATLVPKFTVTPSQEEQVILFDASSSTTTGSPIVSYTWDFGDRRDGATGISVTHRYTEAGVYVVTLTIRDASGGFATTQQTLTVGQAEKPQPVIDFSPTDPSATTQIFFNAIRSTAAAGRRIVSYQWDFGDGSSAQGVQVSHRYAVPGHYVVTLVATDDVGAIGTITSAVTVLAGGSGGGGTGALVVDFTFATPTSTTVAFTAVPPSGHTITTYAWAFDDSDSGLLNQSGTANPVHTFTHPSRTYNVTLIITDDTGQTGSTSKAVIIP
jgi:PKD repeat protein